MDPNFSQCVVNLQVAIDFFENRLGAVDFEVSDYSSSSVLDVINAGLLDWKNVYFKYHVNDQRYEFPEASSTPEFYVPQVWMSIFSSISLWPHPVTFRLFSTNQPFQLSRSLRLQLQKMHEKAAAQQGTAQILDI